MKKILPMFFMLIICCFCFCGCNESENILRIHIRANSNGEYDQSVKLKVRDEVIDYIAPLIAECNNCDDVKDTLSLNLSNIEKIADDVLLAEGFQYTSSARICNEYFPSRNYNGEIYPADYYDALIMELGSGEGDNWWCVAYPPLCFVGEEMGENIQYKSKLVELISKFFGE